MAQAVAKAGEEGRNSHGFAQWHVRSRVDAIGGIHSSGGHRLLDFEAVALTNGATAFRFLPKPLFFHSFELILFVVNHKPLSLNGEHFTAFLVRPKQKVQVGR